MTYHPSERWSDKGTVVSAARGQEFVAIPKDRVAAMAWLSSVLGEVAT